MEGGQNEGERIKSGLKTERKKDGATRKLIVKLKEVNEDENRGRLIHQAGQVFRCACLCVQRRDVNENPPQTAAI